MSNDNAYSEAWFRTAKYAPSFPAEGFESMEAARRWGLEFVRWYNGEHRHSGIGHVTPDERHRGEDTELLARRRKVYAEAKARHPSRWGTRPTRNWEPIKEVWLNPERAPGAELQPA